MKLVFLGTGGYHPNNRRHTACLLFPQIGVMLDAGTGFFRAAKYLSGTHLDIFLTHAHLDHVIGLSYLFDLLAVHPLERITVHGAADKLPAIQEHLFSPTLFPQMPPYRFQPVEQFQPLPDGGVLKHFPLEHPGGVLGFRLDWPSGSMAYVTDTTASPDALYSGSIAGVDLLVHECYFPDKYKDWAIKTGHSWTSAVARLAAKADVGRLLLTHINPLCEDDDPVDLSLARSIFPATDVAEDGMEIGL